jgi:hypothetical protein
MSLGVLVMERNERPAAASEISLLLVFTSKNVVPEKFKPIGRPYFGGVRLDSTVSALDAGTNTL